MRSYHCSGLEKDCIPNSTACSSRVRISPFRWRSRDNRSKPHGRKSSRSCGSVFRSSRPRIGGSGIPRFRKRISSGNRTGIDLLYCSEEPRTLPITWGRRLWRGQRPRPPLQKSRPLAAIGREPVHLTIFHQSLQGKRNDSEGISEIKFGSRTESRKEAARRRASRLERRTVREGWGHAVRFRSGSSFRDCDEGVFSADGSFRPAAELADESLGEYGWPHTDCFRSGEGCYE